uniref:Mediator of RNA polymerase II transcription subunit 17 n=1 Tax=Entomoneis paludosa TaxID=265537 RepID=A0A6U3DUA1_9STRA
MFDAIRREVASDTEEVGQVRTTASAVERATLWVSTSGSAHNQQEQQQFLPTPGAMVRGDLGLGQGIAVIHCHEGEVMIQLDSEYTLRIKLVEAARKGEDHKSSLQNNDTAGSSGGHTPAQLLVLCRALMLHAQEIYHAHSLRQDEARQREEEAEQAKQATSSFALRRKARQATSPRILQKCTCLGSKMLMERRVRGTLKQVQEWMKQSLLPSMPQMTEPIRLQVQWLPLSALDSHAQFTVSLVTANDDNHHCLWYVDVHLTGEKLSVTSFSSAAPAWSSSAAEYRKVDFYSEQELQLFLQHAIRNQLRLLLNQE